MDQRTHISEKLVESHGRHHTVGKDGLYEELVEAVDVRLKYEDFLENSDKIRYDKVIYY